MCGIGTSSRSCIASTRGHLRPNPPSEVNNHEEPIECTAAHRGSRRSDRRNRRRGSRANHDGSNATSVKAVKAGLRYTGVDAATAKHSCKGKNDCKGQGGCKTSDNGCKGKNSCKGKGGCATDGSKMPEARLHRSVISRQDRSAVASQSADPTAFRS